MKLNMEQRRIVELEPNGHMLIKGVAGSGKTTVSTLRIPFLLNHYAHEKDDQILLVTFNKTLLQYIKYLYNKVDNEDELQVGLFEQKNQDRITITTIDSLMYKYFLQYQKRNNINYKIANKTIEHQVMIQAINDIVGTYNKIKLLSPKNSYFLLDEIGWIKACNIIDIDTYQNIDRIGRASGGRGMPQKLIKNSDIRKAIFDLMVRYDQLLENNGLVDFKQMNKIALDEAHRWSNGKFTHIIIDESQDLTKVQLEFIKCIYNEKRYSSIMFVADNTQSIYSHSWLGKGRPYTSIGYDMSGKSRTLSKNYRTTTQISRAAYGLIEHDENIKNNVDYVRPSLIDRQGHAPIYKYFNTREKHLEFLRDEINVLRNDYNYLDICIVAKERRLIEDAYNFLESTIPCEMLTQGNPDFDSDKVKLTTMHSIKGLEFKVIFLIDLNEGIIPNNMNYEMDDDNNMESDERKLLYVGMTRANELLYMSSVGRPSKFIKEINNDHLRIQRDCGIKPFKTIGIPQYQLQDQIADINAREELVRQWLIKELNETYGYPFELMVLEYPVQQFSRRGYVDIAVNIYHKNKEMPYIFAEVKQFGSGIDNAVEQLKSYMDANSDVRYGVATDGIDMIIINRDGDLINDIPKCRPQFLPDKKDKKDYLNFKNNRRYTYAFDKDNRKNIEISDKETELLINYQDIVEIPFLGEVAAGIPIVVNQQFENYIELPEEWIYSRQNTFILKVTGDSMNGIDIDKGDLVIVHKQDMANNGDIVIAIINNEATMKKFMLMGDSILLLSENPNYEPIQMKAEDVIINGKVIGVLKS